MKKDFSRSWNSSIKPNKQRKYRFNAPLHIRGSFLNVHLSKDLRKKHGVRSLRIRVGDKVRILRGQFKKQDAKVEEVNVKDSTLYLSKIEHTKRDGTKARYPIDPSNVMIVELNADDKRRLAKPDDKAVSGGNPENNKTKPEPISKSKPESRAASKPESRSVLKAEHNAAKPAPAKRPVHASVSDEKTVKHLKTKPAADK